MGGAWVWRERERQIGGFRERKYGGGMEEGRRRREIGRFARFLIRHGRAIRHGLTVPRYDIFAENPVLARSCR